MAVKKEERTVSSFGVSIGTGLMLESIFQPTAERYDVTREIPLFLEIDKYEIHIYNIYTLLRNIYSSFVDRKAKIADDVVLGILRDEIYIISSLYESTKCTPVLITPNYDNLIKKLSVDKDTHITKGYIEYREYSAILKSKKFVTKDMESISLKEGYLLPETNNEFLITTHIAADLLNVKQCKNIMLLESHTGALKNRYEFYTKYYPIGKRDLSVFPFCIELLKILGDRSLVKMDKISVRVDLYGIAVSNKWSPRTTHAGVKQGLNKLHKG